MEIFNKNKKTIILLCVLVFLFLVLSIVNSLFLKPKPPIPAAPATAIPQGSPETSQEAENITKNYYPLAPYNVPDKANFYYEYEGRLKLKVYLIGDKIAAQKEFEDWAASKGADLSTHQAQYISP